MFINDFLDFKLKLNDYIWIMDEKGEGFQGNYNDNFNPKERTFQFRNHSNGKTQVVQIDKLQRIVINSRHNKE